MFITDHQLPRLHLFTWFLFIFAQGTTDVKRKHEGSSPSVVCACVCVALVGIGVTGPAAD